MRKNFKSHDQATMAKGVSVVFFSQDTFTLAILTCTVSETEYLECLKNKGFAHTPAS